MQNSKGLTQTKINKDGQETTIKDPDEMDKLISAVNHKASQPNSIKHKDFLNFKFILIIKHTSARVLRFLVGTNKQKSKDARKSFN